MVKEVHDCYIGSLVLNGVLNEGTLDYIIDQINDETNIYRRAAWALYMVHLHPFYDGQKRTAWYIADLILRIDDHYIYVGSEERLRALTKIAEYKCDIEMIETWVRKKARRVPRTRQTRLSFF